MNPSTPVATADAGEIDQLPGILDALIDLAGGRPQGIILVAALAGGPRCRIDLAGFARAAGVPRSSLSRAEASIDRRRHLDRSRRWFPLHRRVRPVAITPVEAGVARLDRQAPG